MNESAMYIRHQRSENRLLKSFELEVEKGQVIEISICMAVEESMHAYHMWLARISSLLSSWHPRDDVRYLSSIGHHVMMCL